MTKTALTIRAVISTLPVIAACALLSTTEARAYTVNPFVVTIEQVGSNVVATGSGEFDVTGFFLFIPDTGILFAHMNPSYPVMSLSKSPVLPLADEYIYLSGISGPTNFGSGGSINASSSSGPEMAFQPGGGGGLLFVPSGYVPGTVFTDQDIFNNTTLAMLGITPGTHVWTWGNAADQSFTIDAIAPTTPLPAALPLFATGLGALGLLGWRRQRKTSVA